MRSVLIACIRAYQRWLSPLLGRNCRFVPSCSAYAVEALTQHGLVRGSAYALWRVLRCQPLCRGGYDPVPAPRIRRAVNDKPSGTATQSSSIQPRPRGGRENHC